MSEDVWREKLCTGDPEAWEKATQAVMTSFHHHRLEPVHQADLRQQVLLEIVKILCQEGRAMNSNFTGYVYRVAARRCIDLIRALGRNAGRKVPLDDVGREPSVETDEPERLARADLARKVEMRVSPACARLFRMHLEEELTFREMGTRLGIREGAATMRYRACLEKARQVVHGLLRGQSA